MKISGCLVMHNVLYRQCLLIGFFSLHYFGSGNTSRDGVWESWEKHRCQFCFGRWNWTNKMPKMVFCAL